MIEKKVQTDQLNYLRKYFYDHFYLDIWIIVSLYLFDVISIEQVLFEENPFFEAKSVIASKIIESLIAMLQFDTLSSYCQSISRYQQNTYLTVIQSWFQRLNLGFDIQSTGLERWRELGDSFIQYFTALETEGDEHPE
ncbi:hypothetical protein RF11_13951 [Thelohanellus kitauei]|uniref:Uncharacterized protein n=1 Tax=Thelohanellus kitauei TaxID=669202 RepID=A0A0C2I6Z8_THEKT|nr:hypothetical protein RF11_13951 [Thelohanellus kitauei]